MKKSFTIIMLALIASYATAQSTQRSEDLKSIPGTWWFMAKLDNPVDTLLLIKSGATPPTNVKILTKDVHSRNRPYCVIICRGGRRWIL
jgi:hypothetical protein